MTQMNNNLELARIAIESDNFEESYRLFSKIIEEDINNFEAWIGKGLSAAFCSELTSLKFKEAMVCIDKAIGLSSNKRVDDILTEKLYQASTIFVDKIRSAISKELIQKRNKPMPIGQLYTVRNIENFADQIETNNEYWTYYDTALKFMDYIIKINQSPQSYKNKLGIIDLIKVETESRLHKDHLDELNNERNKLICLLKQSDSSFIPPANKEKMSGCYIATAVYGDYDNDKVLILRDFRDRQLKSSSIGRLFIHIYYSVSPVLADFIRNKPNINNVIKLSVLDPLVSFLSNSRIIK